MTTPVPLDPAPPALDNLSPEAQRIFGPVLQSLFRPATPNKETPEWTPDSQR